MHGAAVFPPAAFSPALPPGVFPCSVFPRRFPPRRFPRFSQKRRFHPRRFPPFFSKAAFSLAAFPPFSGSLQSILFGFIVPLVRVRFGFLRSAFAVVPFPLWFAFGVVFCCDPRSWCLGVFLRFAFRVGFVFPFGSVCRALSSLWFRFLLGLRSVVVFAALSVCYP